MEVFAWGVLEFVLIKLYLYYKHLCKLGIERGGNELGIAQGIRKAL